MPATQSWRLVDSTELSSSSDEDEKDKPASDSDQPKIQHPWDWVPNDPALVSGREVYLAECALCHNEGEEGAPALTRKDEWATRIATGEEALIGRAIKGFIGEDGEMPARGGSDYLTDDQVASAVRYMIATPK